MLIERLFCVKDFNSGRIWSLHPRAAAHPEEHKDIAFVAVKLDKVHALATVLINLAFVL
jgi:hypothetical protein